MAKFCFLCYDAGGERNTIDRRKQENHSALTHGRDELNRKTAEEIREKEKKTDKERMIKRSQNPQLLQMKVIYLHNCLVSKFNLRIRSSFPSCSQS